MRPTAGPTAPSTPASRAWRALLLALLLGWQAGAIAERVSGTVTQVADGDTLTLLAHDGGTLRVRLAGIDAPEKDQPFGQDARESLAQRVLHRPVTIDLHKKDRYGRHVARVMQAGQDVNLAQVEAGLAWHYKAYAQEQAPAERARYAEAEDAARRQHRGLWSQPAPVAPWVHRQGGR